MTRANPASNTSERSQPGRRGSPSAEAVTPDCQTAPSVTACVSRSAGDCGQVHHLQWVQIRLLNVADVSHCIVGNIEPVVQRQCTRYPWQPVAADVEVIERRKSPKRVVLDHPELVPAQIKMSQIRESRKRACSDVRQTVSGQVKTLEQSLRHEGAGLDVDDSV